MTGCVPPGIKATEYGALIFHGSGTIKSAVVYKLPWPKDLVIKCSEDIQLNESSVSFDKVSEAFGEPADDFKGTQQNRYITFRKPGCSITFEDGTFTGVGIYSSATLVNKKNGMELKLPASESQIHEVFGKPTKISYLTKPSP